MGKFDGILICTDLDGTLLDSDKNISKENLDAIEYFKSEGGLFTFITGRMPFTSSQIYTVLNPNAPFGCVNGGGIFDHRTMEYLWCQETSPSVIELVEYAHKRVPEIGIQVNAFSKLYFCAENGAMARFRKLTGAPNVVADYHEIHEPIAKIVFGDLEVEHIEQLQDALLHHPRAEEFDFIRSERTLFEILPKGASKGGLLSKLAEILGIEMRRTVAVGDFYNDVSMLRAAGAGVAVENAVPDAKAAADYITVHHNNSALAAVIRDIEQGRIKL